MPKTKTPVSIVPTSKDRRVVALAAALGVTTRAAWAMAAAAWEWLDEAADKGVVPGATLVLLDTVVNVDVKGLGEQLVAAGLVGVTEDGLVVPSELVSASKRLEGDANEATERRRKKDRERQARRRKRIRRGGRTSASTAGQQDNQPRVPRPLGKVCGDHVVMLLWGKYEGFVELKGASPPVTASVAEYDYDAVTLADALELLVLQFKKKPAQDGGYRVPRLVDLEAAARLERERQRAADAAAAAEAAADARRAQGNKALLEAAAHAEDDDPERDSPHLSRDVRGRHARCHAPTDAGSAGSPSGDTELGAGARHAPPADAAASSSSFSFGLSHAQQNTTNKAASGSMDRDRTPGVTEAVSDGLPRDRKARDQVLAVRWAAALGVTVDDIRELYRADKDHLRRRLEAAGVDTKTGHPRAGYSTSASSAAQAAGIPLPDLGVGRLRDAMDKAVDEASAADVDEPADAGLGGAADADARRHEPADPSPEPATVDAAS